MLVSIIIPFYNAEKTLDMLYQSICNQTYKNLDIIFVDNGSTDRGYEAIQYYQMLDSRIQLLSETEKGVNYARKKGLHHAKGEYVYFVDADDYIAPIAVESMLKAAMFHNADVVQGKFEYIWDFDYNINCSEVSVSDPSLATDISKSDPNNLYHQSPGLWTHLYKKDFLRDEFFVNLKQEEDWVFMVYIYAFANKIMKIPDVVYYYIKSNNTLSKIDHYEGAYPLLNELGKVFQCYEQKGLLQSCQYQLEGLLLKLYLWKYQHVLLELTCGKQSTRMDMFIDELIDVISLFHIEKHPQVLTSKKLQSAVCHLIEQSAEKEKRMKCTL